MSLKELQYTESRWDLGTEYDLINTRGFLEMIVNADQLNLPPKVRRQIKTQKVSIEKRTEGFLLREVPPSILDMEGMLKGCGLTTKDVLERKRRDIELEAKKFSHRK